MKLTIAGRGGGPAKQNILAVLHRVFRAVRKLFRGASVVRGTLECCEVTSLTYTFAAFAWRSGILPQSLFLLVQCPQWQDPLSCAVSVGGNAPSLSRPLPAPPELAGATPPGGRKPGGAAFTMNKMQDQTRN